jgi:methylphosphotriester-DNA--protein-cysteine methyltransferase
MSYRLIGASGETIDSDAPGRFGGNRRLRIYGRLDCPSARRARPRGYARHRVFFADEATAIAAGYRPCALCMREVYRRWRETESEPPERGARGPT